MTASSEECGEVQSIEAPLAGPGARAQAPLLVVVGPTAVGKTSLSLRLAQALDGEIVSADSRLFYRGMDIGTAKPTSEERARIPHHLIDIASPDETVGLALFRDKATVAIESIHCRSRLPLLVGGTGQYVRAIIEGWRLPRVPPNSVLRGQLEAAARADGAQALHARLDSLDPDAAASIDPRNVRRVVRALEVCLVTGQPFSQLRSKQSPPYRVLQIGLTMPREELLSLADRRVDAMVSRGLEHEVRLLVDQGFGFGLPALSGLGYAQFRGYFEGRATLADVVIEVKRATHSFIRRQYNWFRLSDPAIRWFDVTTTTADEIESEVRTWLASPRGA